MCSISAMVTAYVCNLEVYELTFLGACSPGHLVADEQIFIRGDGGPPRSENTARCRCLLQVRRVASVSHLIGGSKGWWWRRRARTSARDDDGIQRDHGGLRQARGRRRCTGSGGARLAFAGTSARRDAP